MKRYRITRPRHARERWHQHPWVRRDLKEMAIGFSVAATLLFLVVIPLAFVHWASMVGRG